MLKFFFNFLKIAIQIFSVDNGNDLIVIKMAKKTVLKNQFNVLFRFTHIIQGEAQQIALGIIHLFETVVLSRSDRKYLSFVYSDGFMVNFNINFSLVAPNEEVFFDAFWSKINNGLYALYVNHIKTLKMEIPQTYQIKTMMGCIWGIISLWYTKDSLIKKLIHGMDAEHVAFGIRGQNDKTILPNRRFGSTDGSTGSFYFCLFNATILTIEIDQGTVIPG